MDGENWQRAQLLTLRPKITHDTCVKAKDQHSTLWKRRWAGAIRSYWPFSPGYASAIAATISWARRRWPCWSGPSSDFLSAQKLRFPACLHFLWATFWITSLIDCKSRASTGLRTDAQKVSSRLCARVGLPFMSGVMSTQCADGLSRNRSVYWHFRSSRLDRVFWMKNVDSISLENNGGKRNQWLELHLKGKGKCGKIDSLNRLS